MKRIELILSQAIDEDVIAAFEKQGIGKAYTKVPAVMGRGNSTPKMGNSVWPELNCMYVIYCEDSEVAKIRSIVETIREEYPCDGIACFLVDAQVL